MHSSSRWAQGQKSTPSFVTAAGETPTVLDTPVPQALHRYRSPRTAERDASGRRAHSADASSRNRSHSYGATSRNIFDDLVERGKLQQQRKEGLIERAIIEEKKLCRPVPKVSDMAAQLQRTGHIVQRLLQKKKEQDKAMKFQLMEIDNKDKKVLDSYFSPKISGRGTRALGKSRARIEGRWDFRKKERLEALRREAIAKELDEVQDSPDINPRSAAIAARRKERDGLAGYSYFESLIERDRIAKLEHWEKRQIEIARMNPGNPKITALAASMSRPVEDVGERLYQTAADAEARRLERERAKLQEEEELRRAADRSRTRVTPTVAGDLLERHNRYMAKRDEKIRAIRELERQQHTPVINPVSDAIAARLPQSTMERLSTPRRQPVQSVTSPVPASPGNIGPYETPSSMQQSSMSPPAGKVGSFSPREPSEKDIQLYQRMMIAEDRRQARLRAAKDLQERRLHDECTFKPATTGFPIHSVSVPSSDSIYERTQLWARRREERLEQQRNEMEDARQQECTFDPEVDTHTGYPQANAPLENTPGFAEFMQRQEYARRRAAESLNASKDRPGSPSEPWGTSTTVPQEFHFGQGAGEIPALHRPVEAPRRNAELVAAARSEMTPHDREQNLGSPGVAKALAARFIMENRERRLQQRAEESSLHEATEQQQQRTPQQRTPLQQPQYIAPEGTELAQLDEDEFSM